MIVNDPGGLTGGSFGFPTIGGIFEGMSPTSELRAYYWTMLAVAAVSTLGVAMIRNSRLGIALRTIRDAPAYAAARGVNPLRYRMIAFAISGFIAGGLYLSYNHSITSSVMGLTPMSIDVTMLVIGGLGTIAGPLIGTSLLTTIQTLLVEYPGVQLTVLGSILLVIVVFAPGGLVGLIGRVRGKLVRWMDEGGDDISEDAAGVSGSSERST